MTHSKILSTLIVCGLSITAMATTPVRRTLTYTAPNGTQQHVNMWANGRYAVYTLEDGTPVVRCADGQFRPATIQSGRIVPSPISSSTAAEIATTLCEAESKLLQITFYELNALSKAQVIICCL